MCAVSENVNQPGPSEVSPLSLCVPVGTPSPHRPHTLNSTSASKSFQSTVTGELSAPYSKQFVHSKSSQYRKMKTEWKSNVYLARSRIQVSGAWLLGGGEVGSEGAGIRHMRQESTGRRERSPASPGRRPLRPWSWRADALLPRVEGRLLDVLSVPLDEGSRGAGSAASSTRGTRGALTRALSRHF